MIEYVKQICQIYSYHPKIVGKNRISRPYTTSPSPWYPPSCHTSSFRFFLCRPLLLPWYQSDSRYPLPAMPRYNDRNDHNYAAYWREPTHTRGRCILNLEQTSPKKKGRFFVDIRLFNEHSGTRLQTRSCVATGPLCHLLLMEGIRWIVLCLLLVQASSIPAIAQAQEAGQQFHLIYFIIHNSTNCDIYVCGKENEYWTNPPQNYPLFQQVR